MHKSIKISLAQLIPKKGDKENNLNLIFQSLREAKRQKADLVIFPELFLTGYSVGESLEKLSETKEGESLSKIKKICKEVSIHTIVGFPEKGDDEDEFYISSAIINDQGDLVGIYRKTHLFDNEKIYFKKGTDFHVFPTKLGRIGVMICYDLEFPEVARILTLKGAELIVVITANMSPYEEYQYVYMRSRSMENEIPMVICNRLGREEDMNFVGNSMAVDNKGNVLLQMAQSQGIETVRLFVASEKDPKLNYIDNRQPEIYSELLKS